MLKLAKSNKRRGSQRIRREPQSTACQIVTLRHFAPPLRYSALKLTFSTSQGDFKTMLFISENDPVR
jgi:hypothetical protein